WSRGPLNDTPTNRLARACSAAPPPILPDLRTSATFCTRNFIVSFATGLSGKVVYALA
ncbi:MAG: hypothetical protein AVDCRST_MAG22-1410, partial [uncultured Rubrobacteraceae bacterium]